MTISEILAIATKEIGVTEYPPNSNCVKYNDWYYNKKGISGGAYPWCCAFISWLFRSEPTLVKKTASCSDMLNWFKAKGQIVTKPQAGDLVFFKWGNGSKPTDHIGIVKAVNGNTIVTIEGNTSITNQQNGGAVMERTRRSNIVAYARPKYSDSKSTSTGATPTRKSVDEIALEVKAGKWGIGNDRRQRLTAAGYDYKEVQAKVNELYGRK